MKTLSFNGKTIEIFKEDDQIWITSNELACALGYQNYKSVTNLYNANHDEFTSKMTEVTKSMTSKIASNLQSSVRIFSLRGCHLIAMFARTKVAKEFRKWVLDLIESHISNKLSQDICNQECQTRKVTTEQAEIIRKSVDEYCKRNNVNWQKFYPALKKEFGVDSYLDLPAKEFDSVIEYICGEVIDDNFFSKATREQVVFAVALMKAGLARHFEIDRAYEVLKDEIASIRDRLLKVGAAIDDISKNDGIVYDGLAESQLYLGFDSSISKDAIEVAKRLIKKQLVLDL